MRHCLKPWANIQGMYFIFAEDAGVEVKEVTVLPDDEDFLDADMSLHVGGFLAGIGSDVSDVCTRRSIVHCSEGPRFCPDCTSAIQTKCRHPTSVR